MGHVPSSGVVGLTALVHRQLDDEAGPAAVGLLDPDRAAVETHVLGDQGEAEPGAGARSPATGGLAAVEALEDPAPLGRGETRAVVLDRHPDRGPAVLAVGARVAATRVAPPP